MKKITSRQHEIIEHTADIGLRIFGKDLKRLFRSAARGMFSLIARKYVAAKQDKRIVFNIVLSAKTREELLVSWLSELLTLSDIRNIIFTRVQFEKLTATKLKARAEAEKMDKKSYKLKTEIKAVTYHQLKLKKKDGCWQAEVFFDV